jgi:FtsZ-binding cell division protein ZapB
LIVAVYGYWAHLESTIEGQQKTIVTLQTSVATLQANNEKLNATVQANSDAVVKLAEGTQQTVQGFAALQNTVTARTGTLQSQLRGILAEKKPQTCDDTIKYLIDAAQGYHK